MWRCCLVEVSTGLLLRHYRTNIQKQSITKFWYLEDARPRWTSFSLVRGVTCVWTCYDFSAFSLCLWSRGPVLLTVLLVPGWRWAKELAPPWALLECFPPAHSHAVEAARAQEGVLLSGGGGPEQRGCSALPSGGRPSQQCWAGRALGLAMMGDGCPFPYVLLAIQSMCFLVQECKKSFPELVARWWNSGNWATCIVSSATYQETAFPRRGLAPALAGMLRVELSPDLPRRQQSQPLLPEGRAVASLGSFTFRPRDG